MPDMSTLRGDLMSHCPLSVQTSCPVCPFSGETGCRGQYVQSQNGQDGQHVQLGFRHFGVPTSARRKPGRQYRGGIAPAPVVCYISPDSTNDLKSPVLVSTMMWSNTLTPSNSPASLRRRVMARSSLLGVRSAVG